MISRTVLLDPLTRITLKASNLGSTWYDSSSDEPIHPTTDFSNSECEQSERRSRRKRVRSKHLNSDAEEETQERTDEVASSQRSQRTRKMPGHLKHFFPYE